MTATVRLDTHQKISLVCVPHIDATFLKLFYVVVLTVFSMSHKILKFGPEPRSKEAC